MKWRIDFRHLACFAFTALVFPSLSASTREVYNLAAIKSKLTLKAEDDPVSVTFARTDGQPSSCKVKLAVTIEGKVEKNGQTEGFFDEVVLGVNGVDKTAFAGDSGGSGGTVSVDKTATIEIEVSPGDEITLSYLTRNAYWNDGGEAKVTDVKEIAGDCGDCGTGGGGVTNSCVSVEIDLGGQVSTGNRAGKLQMKVASPTATAYSPAILTLTSGLYQRTAAERMLAAGSTPSMLVLNSTGTLWMVGETMRQVLTPSGVFDIVPISATKFEVRVYDRSRVGSITAGVLLAISGDPANTLTTWTIENPEPAGSLPNHVVRVTRQSDCFTQVSDFQWNEAQGDWALSRGVGSDRITERRTKSSPVSGVTVERREILNQASAVVYEERETWETTSIGERPLARTVGSGAQARTTIYEYWLPNSGANRAGRLKRQTSPEGRWEYFHDYDAQGKVTKKVEQYLNNPFTGGWPDMVNRMTETQRVNSGEPFEEFFEATLGNFVTHSSAPPLNWAHRALSQEKHAAYDGIGKASVDTWLISPPLNLTGSEEVRFSFRSGNNFASGTQPSRQVYLLKNYSGSGSPLDSGQAVDITTRFGSSLMAGTWGKIGPTDITSEVVPGVRIAFRYNGNNSLWKIDDVIFTLRRQIEDITTVTLAGHVIAKSWQRDSTPVDNRKWHTEPIDGRVVTTAIASDLAATILESPGNRITRYEYYPKNATAPGLPNQLKRTYHPDGNLSLFQYEKTSSDGLLVKEWTGEANTAGTSILHGFLSVREENSGGHIIATQRYYVKSGDADLLIESMAASEIDLLGRPTKFVFGDGSIVQRTYGCSGLKSEIDREGVRTENKFDDHGRLYQTERWHGNVRESYVRYEMDAAGHRAKEFRWGRESGSEQLVRERSYHTNSESAWEIDVLNRQINFNETTNSQTGITTHSQSLPSLTQLIARAEAHYPDGSLYQISGAAVTPMRQLHSVEENPAQPGRYLPIITSAVLDAAGNLPMANGTLSGEFSAQGTGPGGAYSFERRPAADGNGTVLTQTWTDADGRPTKRIQADGRTELASHTLFESLTALDVDGDGAIGLDGADTVRRSRRTYLTAHGTIVQRDTLEERTDANTWQLITQTDTEMRDLNANGRETWVTHYTSYPVRTQETINREDRTRKVVTTLPDLSRRVVEYTNGRLTRDYSLPASGEIPAHTVVRTYDGLGRVTKLADSLTGETDYTYHADDRVAQITSPDPDPTQTGSGFDRQVVTTSYAAQSNGDELAITTLPGGLVQKSLTNPRGQLVKQWGYGANPQEFTYTPAGRVQTLTTWQAFDHSAGSGLTGSATTFWRYHATGLLDQVFYNYQGADPQNPGAVLGVSGQRYEYTAGGLLRKRLAARKNAANLQVETLYHYADGSGGETHSRRLVGLSYLHHDTASANVSYTYYRNGEVKRVTDSSGTRLHEFTEGRLSKVAYESGPLANLAVDRSHEAATGGRLAQLGAGFTSETPFHTVNFGYADDYGRLKTLTTAGSTMSYAYQSDTNDAVSLTYGAVSDPLFVQEWQRDQLRRVHTVRATRGTGGNQQLYHQTLRRYDDLNRATRDTQLGDNYWGYTYDALGQVSAAQKKRASEAAMPGYLFGYGHDAIGNRTGTEVNGRTAAYTANLLNQYEQRAVPGAIDVRGAAPTNVQILVNDTVLTRAQGTGAAVDFHHVVAVENSTNAIAQHLRVQAVDLAATPPEVATTRRDVFVAQTPETFVHDADGNLTEDGRWRYTWDAENRLVALETKPSAAVSVGLPRQRLEFAYDDSARRIMKRVLTWNEAITSYEWTRETRFLWDGWTLLAELDATAQGALTPKAAYTWGREFAEGAGDGARQLVHVQRLTGAAPGTYAPIYGHNYNLAGYVALATGEHAAAYDYGAFGESVSVSGTLPREFSFRFSTKFSDDETGLSYYGFRYLNTGAGRWLSRDPLGFDDGPNIFAFVANAPLSFFDIDGRSKAGWTLDQILSPQGRAALARVERQLQDAKTAARAGDHNSQEMLKQAEAKYHQGLVEVAGELSKAGANGVNSKQIADILDAALSGRKNVLDPEKILKLGFGISCVHAAMKVYECYLAAGTE
ncbi:MAG: RHS repeat-associated core domain-containing protein, partial [Candidatus Didemnitutus sp.]|nr:RHS repeat-associated core domain-containing protein [Candidatus Didemnitutus sp.]